MLQNYDGRAFQRVGAATQKALSLEVNARDRTQMQGIVSETVRLASAGRTGIEGRGSEGFLSETLGATNRSTVLLLFILGRLDGT